MAVIPVITLAQTADTRGEDASTPIGWTPTPPVSDTAADTGRFYFVTGVVFDWSEETRFQDKNCASTSPAALYGCGNGLDGTPFGARGDFGTMTGFDLGFGYAMTAAASKRTGQLKNVNATSVANLAAVAVKRVISPSSGPFPEHSGRQR